MKAYKWDLMPVLKNLMGEEMKDEKGQPFLIKDMIRRIIGDAPAKDEKQAKVIMGIIRQINDLSKLQTGIYIGAEELEVIRDRVKERVKDYPAIFIGQVVEVLDGIEKAEKEVTA